MKQRFRVFTALVGGINLGEQGQKVTQIKCHQEPNVYGLTAAGLRVDIHGSCCHGGLLPLRLYRSTQAGLTPDAMLVLDSQAATRAI